MYLLLGDRLYWFSEKRKRKVVCQCPSSQLRCGGVSCAPTPRREEGCEAILLVGYKEHHGVHDHSVLKTRDYLTN